MSIGPLSWCLLSTLLLAGMPAAGASPEVAFEPEAVVVSGITPKGKVVWFSVARELAEYAATVVRRDQVLEDEDGDGTVRLDLGRPVPPLSVWLAVDLATGAYVVATPEGSTADESPGNFSPVRGGAGDRSWTETGHAYLEMAVIRPTEGTWVGTLGDGGTFDEDGTEDGRITASLSRLRSLPDGPTPPEALAAGDLVTVVDANTLQYSIDVVAVKP